MFRVGSYYTRNLIHDALGGSTQSYLPTKDRHVLCACLTKKLNPKAPEVILVGDGPDITRVGEWLSEQSSAIPVFLKQRSNAWEYVGDYVVQSATTDAATITREAAIVGRNDVTRVVYMKRTT
jgi:hypothetical protein